MAFWREPRRPTAEDQKRTNEVLAAFETSFDGGASKASLLYWIATRPAADAETKALLAKAEAGG